jgi:hypothetical protein
MAGTATPELRIRILVASISLLTVVKRCGCGVEHNALSWSRLPPRGVQRLDGLGPDIELRNCSCGSTLGIELPGEKKRMLIPTPAWLKEKRGAGGAGICPRCRGSSADSAHTPVQTGNGVRPRFPNGETGLSMAGTIKNVGDHFKMSG